MSGILNRAIKGMQRVMERDLQFQNPESVEKATGKWLGQSNPLPTFIEECCRVDPSCASFATDLYSAYVLWAQSNGYKNIQQAQAFQKKLSHLGHTKINRGNRGVRISGLRLLNPSTSKFAH